SCSVDACEICGGVGPLRADADGAGLGSNTLVPYIDIVVARGEIGTGETAQRDVSQAGGVIQQRPLTVAPIVGAARILIYRKITSSRILIAGDVEKHRPITIDRVLFASGVENHRESPVSR